LRLPFELLDRRPIVVALAGSNGAGKSTFYEAFLADSGLRFLNADVLSASLNVNGRSIVPNRSEPETTATGKTKQPNGASPIPSNRHLDHFRKEWI
jgi:dephospho-CoA kinase